MGTLERVFFQRIWCPRQEKEGVEKFFMGFVIAAKFDFQLCPVVKKREWLQINAFVIP